jgi:hypothetical protein
MNPVSKAVQAILNARHLRAAREARAQFLQQYNPQQAQQLLDTLHNAWHLHDTLHNDEELQRIYSYYKRLSLLLAAEYTLLKAGKRWLEPAQQ